MFVVCRRLRSCRDLILVKIWLDVYLLVLFLQFSCTHNLGTVIATRSVKKCEFKFSVIVIVIVTGLSFQKFHLMHATFSHTLLLQNMHAVFIPLDLASYNNQ